MTQSNIKNINNKKMYFLKNVNIYKLHWVNFFIITIGFMTSGNDENDTH